MWIALLCAILFAAGGISNLVGSKPDHSEAVVGLSIAACLLGVFLFFRREAKRSEVFLTWLIQNGDAVKQGEAQYDGACIRETTQVTRYQAALSFLIVSMKLPSAFYVEHQDRVLTAALYTFTSLLLGWWGIPWGPIYTVQAVSSNVTGGQKSTVGQLLEELRAGAQKETS